MSLQELLNKYREVESSLIIQTFFYRMQSNLPFSRNFFILLFSLRMQKSVGYSVAKQNV